ncbi:hypothetical protein PMIN04_000652 [Paraphaeosphaeria minitans]
MAFIKQHERNHQRPRSTQLLAGTRFLGANMNRFPGANMNMFCKCGEAARLCPCHVRARRHCVLLRHRFSTAKVK